MRGFYLVLIAVFLGMVSACAEPVVVREAKPSVSADKAKPAPAPVMNAKAYYERGLKASSQKDAIEAFTKALQLDPRLAEAYLGRGNAYTELKKPVQAVRDYSQYLLLRPRDISGYYKRAAAYGQAGDYKRCIDDWDTVIAESPREANVYYLRGNCYELSGNKEQATEDYKSAAMLGHGPAQAELKSRGIQW